MKRTAMFFVLSFILIAMTACGGVPNSSNTPSSQAASGAESSDAAKTVQTSNEAKTLDVWYTSVDSETEKIIRGLAEDFKKDGVTVNVSFTQADPYRTKLKTVMGSGGAPDVFVNWGGGATEQFISEGQLFDITDKVQDWKNDVFSASWNEVTFGDDNRIYGVPYNIHGSMMFYNKTMFAKLGLKPPATYAELEKVADTLIKNKVIPFALGNSPRWPGAIYHSDLVMQIGGKEVLANLVNNKGSAFMDEAFIKASQLVLDEYKAGWFPEGANGINYETGGSRSLFYDGKAGMMVVNTNFPPRAKDEAPDFYANDLGIMPFPIYEGGKGNEGIICGVEALSVTNKCKYKDEAIEFIRRFTTDPDIVTRRGNDGGVMVTWTGIKYTEQMRQDAWNQLTSAKYMNNYIADSLNADLGNLYWDTTQALFGGMLTAEEASQQLQKLADQLIPKN